MDAEDLRHNPASDVHVKRFKAKELEEGRLEFRCIFSYENGSKQLEGRHPRSVPDAISNAVGDRKQEEETAGSDLLRMSEQEQEIERQVLSEADRSTIEARSDFWCSTGNFVFKHHVIPERKLYVPKEDSPIRRVTM